MNDPSGPGDRSRADRVRSIVGDIRALGIGAPLRAAYEASKRIGGHTIVFRRLVPTTADNQTGQIPFSIPSVPQPVRERTVAEADRIVGGTIEVFGHRMDMGDPPNWHAIIHTDGSWPAVDWWRIDLRSDARPGDVKWAWELGRHRHLVILARAAHLEPAEDRYLKTLDRHLASWLESNPPETGVHWYSNLEIALRAIAWLQILALVGERLDPGVREGMWRHLHHSGRHLIADLPYTVSTMRNNHLLGDALGLIALGKAFGGKSGRRWESIGNRIFDKQLTRHMHSDGSMIEDSLSYHRFVLEMLSMRVVLGGEGSAVREAMSNAAQFLARLGSLDGPVPQYGDWDEGRVFAVAHDPAHLSGSVRLALALGGDGAPVEWRRQHDEVAWFASEGTPVLPEPAESGGHDVGAGIGRAAVGPFTVWLKGGSAPSHGHADLSSVAIAHKGHWLVGDPGTGTYNGPIEQRTYFRSSAAHNVVRVDGEDQLGPHRVFRWEYTARGSLEEPIRTDDGVTMWSIHDAYARLDPPRLAVRAVTVSESGVEVHDFVEGHLTTLELSLPLGPECTWDAAESSIEMAGLHFALGLPCDPCDTGEERVGSSDIGWSRTYGDIALSTVLRCRCVDTPSLCWSVRRNDVDDSVHFDDESHGVAPAVGFGSATVDLTVGSGERREIRSVTTLVRRSQSCSRRKSNSG